MKKLWNLKYTLCSFAVLLLLWQILVWSGKFNEALLPSPLTVGKALHELAADGSLANHVSASLWRFAVGYWCAVGSGALFGLFLGWHRGLFAYANPVLQFLRPIAPVAWLPFIVLLIGIGDLPAVAIIFLAGFFPVLLSTAGAVRKIDPTYLKVAANYGIRGPAVLYKIVFPAVFPSIANSLHIALGSAWIFLVSGEMVGAQSGLGFLIIDGRNNMRTDHLLAAMAVIGLIGVLLDWGIGCFERFVFKLWGVSDHVY